MARNYSFVKLEGSLDDLTFYQKDGVNLVKKKSRVSKNRIMNDPTFKRTRENMREFAGAAKVGKAFRDCLAGVYHLMSDTYMGARINGRFKTINRTGAGPRGQRDFDVVDNSGMIVGFEYNRLEPFNSRFFAHYAIPSINPARDQVNWTVSDFDTDTYIFAPEAATHFRLVLAAGYVSDYSYSEVQEEYVPDTEDVNGMGLVANSAQLPLGGMVGSATTLTVDMSSFGTIPVTSAMFVSIGIIFYQEINAVLYELKEGNAMKVVTAG